MASSSHRAPLASTLRAVSRVAAFAVCALTQQGGLLAENFRIETNVFMGDNEKPISETTTLFHDGVVYDFIKQPKQTAVFDKPKGKNAGRFILLSDEHRIRTEIPTDRVKGVVEDVRTWASQQKDPFLKFAANPNFEESFEPSSGQLVLASHWESYTVETTPAKHPKAAAEYRVFLDWYAQLNTLLSGGAPPQPRLELNESLSRHKAIPTVVELTRKGDKEPLRAEHEFTWLLSKDDLERIDDVRAALASYQQVDNSEYKSRTQEVATNE
jgi:hypothetical protein